MIIYLTGSPASGKTTLCETLAGKVEGLIHFRFGSALTGLLQKQHSVTQEELRTATAHISTPDLVDTVNEMAISVCEDNRNRRHVIVDTHAVTTENSGFRITPMSTEQMARMNPDMFVCLTAQPSVRQTRVKKAARGRPSLSEEQLRLQANLQESLIVGYAASLGTPAYFMKNEKPEDLIVIEAELLKMMEDS